MTSAISAVSGLSGVGGLNAVSGISGVGGVSGLGATSGPAAAGGAGGDDFASVLAKGLQNVQASQANADNLAVQVANGTLSDPAQYTMAATEAQLGLQLTTAIRNKAVDAFQEIMRMQA
jgi:flagellar hook-basal body complex protein FliE